MGISRGLILSFFLVLYPCLSYGQVDYAVAFDHLSTKDGLSNNQINAILEDKQGFMWFGTLSGLNRYDGYDFQVFTSEGSQPAGLPNNAILWLENGPDSTVWMQTGNEISIYSPIYERFEPIEPWYEKLGVPESSIQGMTNSDQHTWFWLQGNGAIMYNEMTQEIWTLNTSGNSDITLGSNDIERIRIDRFHNAWILYKNGRLDVIDTQLKAIARKFDFSELIDHPSHLDFYIDSDLDLWLYSLNGQFGVIYVNTINGSRKLIKEDILGSNLINSMIQDKRGYFWIGKDHGGVTIIDKKSWQTKELRHQVNNDHSLEKDNVKCMYRSSSGMIWVGMIRNGLSYFNENSSKIPLYRFDSDDPVYNDMTSLAEDNKGNLWIGTNGKGLLRFDLNNRSFSSPVRLDPASNIKGPDVVVSLKYATDHCLWVGTYTKGLFSIIDSNIKNYNAAGHPVIPDNNIWCIEEDRERNILFGTIEAGLVILNVKNDEVRSIRQTDGLLSNYVTDILEDQSGQFWIATGNGLSIYNPKSGKFKSYTTSDGSSNPISNNSIVSIFQDRQGMIWVGTLNGLNKYNHEIEGFRSYFIEDGLPSNIIMSIVQDTEGFLWIASDNSLSKIKVEGKNFEVQSFSGSDGLQRGSFNERACLLTSGGLLAFAGQNGLNLFDPKDIIVDNKAPHLVITKFFLNNTWMLPTRAEGRNIINRNINYINKLRLNHKENSFAFEFAALTYDQSLGNQYEYLLEGFENQWIRTTGDNRRAVYTNINPGTYTFKVRGSNSHNVWAESPKSIIIIIEPPFSKTVWANFLYVIAAFALLYLIRYIIVSREREKAKIENERLNAQRLHELDLLKLKFFTNISHEFRTPLSLVLTPIERIIKYPDRRSDTDFHLINKNARRLLTLVNQLLDFRKLEANQHKLYLSSGDIVEFMKEEIESFSDLAIEKETRIELVTDIRECICYFDKDKMDKIIFNLISNAFKFTLPGGKIEVEIEKDQQDDLCIQVRDTGIGIPEDKLDIIFQPFIQGDNPRTIVNSGTGIGLSITKEFVELHEGRLSVESKLDHGSTFTVIIPIEKLRSRAIEAHRESELENEVKESKPEISKTTEKPRIFLVEDHSDFMFYIKDNLAWEFTVDVASNGHDAWKKILHHPPDVIISDVLMPVMDGLELCKKVKSDPRTADIPVILLTAQTSNEQKLKGFQAGANEYITKPFNFEILVSCIKSALKFRKDVIDANKKPNVEASDIKIVSVDEKFLQDAKKLVENNLSNPDFSVAAMSYELGYSRGHLYQKMLHILGKTPLEFIRDLRMEHAAKYLLKSQLTISEVAYKVGYNNPKLFSRYFKSKFNVSPSKYQDKNPALKEDINS